MKLKKCTDGGATSTVHLVQSQLPALANLSAADLRKCWKRELKTEPPPIRSPDILRCLLAWQIQAAAFGGLDRESALTLSKIGETLERDGSYEPKIRRGFSEGTILTREWKGAVHKVAVVGDGFQYLNKNYRSLSDIARTVTGTRWSGPRFFGLEQIDRRRSRNPPAIDRQSDGSNGEPS